MGHGVIGQNTLLGCGSGYNTEHRTGGFNQVHSLSFESAIITNTSHKPSWDRTIRYWPAPITCRARRGSFGEPAPAPA